jgi:hypothetical protein
MQPIAAAVPKAALLAELNKDRFVRNTNNLNNEIYIVNIHNSPNVLREIGRLRELAFRGGGGGSGQEVDLDELDLSEIPYEQLIVWNPEDQEIVGGYRFLVCKDAAIKDGIHQLATTELFEYQPKFIEDYLPHTIELGRSFVQPLYQAAAGRKGLFSLDNLWDGLGALVIDYPDMKYFFGKVTMYNTFNVEARDLILTFLKNVFPDPDNMVIPHHSVELVHDTTDFAAKIKGLDYKQAHTILAQSVRALGENVPPLVNAYMNLSPSMKTFGTSINEHFGAVEETGILLTIADIYPEKGARHIDTYKN